jgi:hypothetical protein
MTLRVSRGAAAVVVVVRDHCGEGVTLEAVAPEAPGQNECAPWIPAPEVLLVVWQMPRTVF